MTSKPAPPVQRLVENKEYGLEGSWNNIKMMEFCLYDKDDKVNPLEPLRRGTKVEEKWQNGLRASKPRQMVRKFQQRGEISFHEIRCRHNMMIKRIWEDAIARTLK